MLVTLSILVAILHIGIVWFVWFAIQNKISKTFLAIITAGIVIVSSSVIGAVLGYLIKSIAEYPRNY